MADAYYIARCRPVLHGWKLAVFRVENDGENEVLIEGQNTDLVYHTRLHMQRAMESIKDADVERQARLSLPVEEYRLS